MLFLSKDTYLGFEIVLNLFQKKIPESCVTPCYWPPLLSTCQNATEPKPKKEILNVFRRLFWCCGSSISGISHNKRQLPHILDVSAAVHPHKHTVAGTRTHIQDTKIHYTDI